MEYVEEQGPLLESLVYLNQAKVVGKQDPKKKGN